jgi:hypothetical protein
MTPDEIEAAKVRRKAKLDVEYANEAARRTARTLAALAPQLAALRARQKAPE